MATYTLGGSNTLSVQVTASAFTVNIVPSAGCTVTAGDGGVDAVETNGIVCSSMTTDEALCTEQFQNNTVAALKVTPAQTNAFQTRITR